MHVASPPGAEPSSSVKSRRSFKARDDGGFEAGETGSEQDDDGPGDWQSRRLAGARPEPVSEAPAKGKGKGKQKKASKDADAEPEGPEEPEQPERSTLTVRQQLSEVPLIGPFGLMVGLLPPQQDRSVRSSGFGVLSTPPVGYKKAPQVRSEPPSLDGRPERRSWEEAAPACCDDNSEIEDEDDEEDDEPDDRPLGSMSNSGLKKQTQRGTIGNSKEKREEAQSETNRKKLSCLEKRWGSDGRRRVNCARRQGG